MGFDLSEKMISDLLVSAFEGGSNYWVDHVDYIPPKGMALDELEKLAWKHAPQEEKDFWKTPERVPLYSLISYLPTSVKWKFRFVPNEVVQKEGERFYLTSEKISKGLDNLWKKHGHIVARIIQEDSDAGDADAWLQAAIFGDVIFG